jgi:hypothetical protein
MRVKSVTFGFTKNLGNYQSARAEVTVELDQVDWDRSHPEAATDTAMVLACAIVKDTLDVKLNADEANVLALYQKGVKL